MTVNPSDPFLTGQHEPGFSETDKRRNFLWGLAALISGAVVGIVPALIGVRSYLDPLLGKRRSPIKYHSDGEANEGLIKIATLEAVPEDGIPRRFPVIADVNDGWNFSPAQPIGSVYLRRMKGSNTVQVLHSTCPHAGCSVAYTHDPVPANCLYRCPCHNSAFDLDGEKVALPGKENPSPRPMDTLYVDDKKLAESKEIWIKFQNFYTGVHEKKPKT